MKTTARAQRYLLGVWIAISLVTPFFGWLGARGFAPGVWIAGVLCLPFLRPRREDWPLLGVLGVLVAWMAVSMAWSPAANVVVHNSKDFSRLTALHMAQQLVMSSAFVLGARAMQADTAKKALTWMAWSLVALSAILVIEGLTQATLFQHAQVLIHKTVQPDRAVVDVSQGSYVLVALLWPAAAILHRAGKTWAAGILAVSVVVSTVTLHGDAPSLALVLSAAAFFAVLAWGRTAVLGVMGMTAVYWAAMPAIMLNLGQDGIFARVHDALPPSWGQRVRIWDFASRLWLVHPFRGLGIDSSRAFNNLIPLHPHDGALQIWFELGLPGAILMLAFWLLLFRKVAGSDSGRLSAAAATGAMVVYLTIGAVSFGLWQEWWVCVGALILAACAALSQAEAGAARSAG